MLKASQKIGTDWLVCRGQGHKEHGIAVVEQSDRDLPSRLKQVGRSSPHAYGFSSHGGAAMQGKAVPC